MVATAGSCVPSRWWYTRGLPVTVSQALPECDSTDPGNVCPGKSVGCSTSRLECSRRTRCRLILCSPEGEAVEHCYKFGILEFLEFVTKSLSIVLIYLRVEHNLWGAIPSCSHILCQESSVIVLWVSYSS